MEILIDSVLCELLVSTFVFKALPICFQPPTQPWFNNAWIIVPVRRSPPFQDGAQRGSCREAFGGANLETFGQSSHTCKVPLLLVVGRGLVDWSMRPKYLKTLHDGDMRSAHSWGLACSTDFTDPTDFFFFFFYKDM